MVPRDGSRGPLRVLMVLEAGDFYPSGFIRGLIYRDHFLRDGIDVRYANRLVMPLLRIRSRPPRLLSFFFRFGFAWRTFVKLEDLATKASEAAIARAARDVDVVYMSKVTSLAFVNRLRISTKARLVLDFGDAVWLPRYAIDGFDKLLATVDAVTTDNELTADYIRRFNPNCTVVSDCPQVEWFDRMRAKVRKADSRTVTLGWIGSQSTAYNLYVIWEALERVFSRHSNLHLRLVGATPQVLPPFEKVQYSTVASYAQAQMIEEVLRMDVGLFPLQDVEACRVRGVLKAAVYMSGEAAVVCSPVGQCVDLIQDGVNGMLAGSTKEWEDKLEQLILDQNLRRRIAQAGLEHVRSRFTVEKSFSLLKSVLEG